MVLPEMYQKSKSQFLKELRVSFKVELNFMKIIIVYWLYQNIKIIKTLIF